MSESKNLTKNRLKTLPGFVSKHFPHSVSWQQETLAQYHSLAD